MKILCYINHFFGRNPKFLGKSSFPDETTEEQIRKKGEVRKRYIDQVIAQLKKIEGIEIKVCGIEGSALVPVDISFEHIRDKPLWMIYESLNCMADHVDEYDYFINIEDDIFLPEETFKNILDFDKESMVNEILLPNRLEQDASGKSFCVDLSALPGWTQQRKTFRNKTLQVALNAHSGLLILSKEKLRYALRHIDRKFRAPLLYNELDSAFAYYHSSFALFRSTDIDFANVIHLDKWSYSPGEVLGPNVWKQRFESIKGVDFFPPLVVRVVNFVQKKIFKKINN